MTLRNIHAFGRTWNMEVTRDGEKIKVTITDAAGKELYNKSLAPRETHKIDLS